MAYADVSDSTSTDLSRCRTERVMTCARPGKVLVAAKPNDSELCRMYDDAECGTEVIVCRGFLGGFCTAQAPSYAAHLADCDPVLTTRMSARRDPIPAAPKCGIHRSICVTLRR